MISQRMKTAGNPRVIAIPPTASLNLLRLMRPGRSISHKGVFVCVIRNCERIQNERRIFQIEFVPHTHTHTKSCFIISNTHVYEHRPHVINKGEVLVSKLPPFPKALKVMSALNMKIEQRSKRSAPKKKKKTFFLLHAFQNCH